MLIGLLQETNMWATAAPHHGYLHRLQTEHGITKTDPVTKLPSYVLLLTDAQPFHQKQH